MVWNAQIAAGSQVAGGGLEVAADTTWSVYTVRPGDTLFSISRRHDAPMDSLRVWNGVSASDLRAGMELRVGYDLVAPKEVASDSLHRALHDVISSYGLADSLYAWQRGSDAWLGETMVQRTTAERPPRVHIVTAGETLYGVSRTYGVDSERLREANNMSGTGLRTGQELRIPGSDGSVTASGMDVLPPVHEMASVLAWPPSFDGQPMQNGETYDPAGWYAGHPTWPIGAIVLFENPETGRMALAQVADRTPGAELGVVDVSAAVHEALGLGTASRVRVRLLPWRLSAHTHTPEGQ